MQVASAHVVDRLCQRFPTVPEETVIGIVAAIEETFRDARIRDYIPLLVEREARDLLSRGVRETNLAAELCLR